MRRGKGVSCLAHARERTDELSRLVEGEAKDRAFVVPVDEAELRQVARALLGPRRPDKDLWILAHLARDDREPVLRAHVERGDVIVVAMKVPLLVVRLVIHDAECRVVVD